MFDRIIQFSIQRKLFVGLTVLFLIASGIYSMMNIPVDAVPDITNNQVQVVTVAPSLAPQEVEKFITYPVEVAMANILNVVEIRSVSRFGLSVVTIVFKDHVPILNARQLVNEQIQVVAAELPSGYGIPQLMPITTGLGEIFQYTLGVDKKHKDDYSPTDLRTIQDWIVKRQLSGIPGIVEISSFGGYLKQYEVAVEPARLQSLNVTISDVFDALEKNNQNSGGSYIEKYNNAYYIRTEGLLKDLDEIRKIVVKNVRGIPVLVGDVGTVHYGSAPRFGAMTRNGKGEAVGGITLMLKGANSSQVISEVKHRVATVQKMLPEGISIVPYLDRSKLVSKTIHTVSKNLIEGGLIVIFVLVLLLGNIRAGIIVASVIPLSLLFAFIMMHLFGVSANLMSLGAIDFGIVIDGAVIIVESVIHYIYTRHKGETINQEQMDSIVFSSTSKIYKNAAFGVAIILIVFFPILSLVGIEGKTFRPMAQTVSFAILGALLLSLTYVPMVSSLFLNKHIVDKENLSDKVINLLKRTYAPVLRVSLRFRYTLLSLTALVFILSIWGFTHLGGEFLPQLDEGDLAMQMTLPPGSSLTESMEISTRAEKVLMQNFPEVIQVVSKIGTAEVPTDPMAVENADIMISLKERDQWVSARSRDELVDKMKAKLGVITGASFDFTQPIQLRFNELMTGAKTDIAVKIYGEDMDELYRQANKAAGLIAGIQGAADIKVEQIQGLPQLLVRYKRDMIARYGLNIDDLNQIIRSSYAGGVAGSIYEGERKFDLVVRLDSKDRKSVDLNNLFIRLENGSQLPLSEVATLDYVEGPMQISRDNTHRRITVGINVRNKDVETLVGEIRSRLESDIKLPPGYYITYGGQFENLEKAKKRLSVAIPAALSLILLLLFFTFNSVKYALLIFTAVPLSAIGGIIALAIRGMHFSISAGVGFIALFGVAVLNGIVLIGYYNQLRKEGNLTLPEIIEQGAMLRLRPVMMTAMVASLGFLPMALSTSAGAEVQKPLATVVIGGLITSTLLTMIILPILYGLFNSEWKIFRIRINFAALPVILLFLFLPMGLNGQTKVITQEEAVTLALKNHPLVKNADLNVKKSGALREAAFDLPSTELNYQYGQLNSALKDRYWDVRQSFGSIPGHFARMGLAKNQVELSRTELVIAQRDITLQVRSVWNAWIYQKNITQLLKDEITEYSRFLNVVKQQYELGESGMLAKVMAENKYASLSNSLSSSMDEESMAENRLRQFILLEDSLVPDKPVLDMLPLPRMTDSAMSAPGIMLNYYEQQAAVQKSKQNIERSKFFPEMYAGYFNQEIDQVRGFSGWQAGLSFPLWFLPKHAAARQARYDRQMAQNELEYQQYALAKVTGNLRLKILNRQKQITYYQQYALRQADVILSTAKIQYQKEEIGYLEYLQSFSAAMSAKKEYLQVLSEYNQSILELEFYLP